MHSVGLFHDSSPYVRGSLILRFGRCGQSPVYLVLTAAATATAMLCKEVGITALVGVLLCVPVSVCHFLPYAQ